MSKIVIVAFLLAIVIALGAGMVSMVRGSRGDNRTVRALTWRIGLSLLLVGLLVAGYYLGIIQPHGVIQ